MKQTIGKSKSTGENECMATERKEMSSASEKEGKFTFTIDDINHIYEELRFIVGVLDMLFLIDTTDAWSMRNEAIGMVIIDARCRAEALSERL